MKICILYGGLSEEREVSINSGKSIFDCLSKKYDVFLYDFDGNYRKLHNNIKDVDLVFNALHGGDGENGTVQLFLEKNNIQYTGSNSSSSKIAMDKSLTKDICAKNNIPTPNGLIFNGYIEEDSLLAFNHKSLVIKPSDEGSSIGLSIIQNFNLDIKEKIDELQISIDKCCKVSNNIIVEEYIAGRELTVPILDDDVLPCIEIIPKDIYYNYDCKYKKGESEYIVPANLDSRNNNLLEQYSKNIFNLLGCSQYARVDFRLSKDNELFLLEVNTLPGFTETSLFPKSAESKNIDYFNLLDKIISLAKK
tara:strand:+ start:437 stop:1357 length:921 start_codon:yes stop_codon:yes gene_type:complete